MFGHNAKAQLAARTVFGLAHRHSDILHDGWKNILDCMLQLFRAKLLAEVLVMVCRALIVSLTCVLEFNLIWCLLFCAICAVQMMMMMMQMQLSLQLTQQFLWSFSFL